jgi:large subunit ribosomal protein L9
VEVILLSDHRYLGRRGEVVKVKPGYARNFLLPQGIAITATPGNLKVFGEQRKKLDARFAKEREAALEIAARLNGMQITVPKRVGETNTLYGAVTSSEVAELLAAKGVTVDRRRIEMEHGIKTLGDHTVTVDLYGDVKAEITVSVVAEA